MGKSLKTTTLTTLNMIRIHHCPPHILIKIPMPTFSKHKILRLFLTVVTSLTLLFLWLGRQPDPLREIAEPITIVDAMSWDDGGSHGLLFKDAKHKQYSVCLMDNLRGQQNLIAGSYTPIHDKRQLSYWPIGGPRERAFLKLLERWATGDPDAILLNHRLDLYERGKIDQDSLWDGVSEGQQIKAIAIGILRDLRRRNQGSSGRD